MTEYLPFISCLIKSIAWPVAVVLIVLLLRRSLAHLILSLKSFRYRDLELGFEQKLSEVKRGFKKIEIDTSSDNSKSTPLWNRILNQTEESPTSSILNAWEEILSTIEYLAEKYEFSIHIFPFRKMIEDLCDMRIINIEQAEVIENLLALRNLAAHGGDLRINVRQAREVIFLSRKLAEYLKRLKVRPIES